MQKKLDLTIWACVEYSIVGINIHPCRRLLLHLQQPGQRGVSGPPRHLLPDPALDGRPAADAVLHQGRPQEGEEEDEQRAGGGQGKDTELVTAHQTFR